MHWSLDAPSLQHVLDGKQEVETCSRRSEFASAAFLADFVFGFEGRVPVRPVSVGDRCARNATENQCSVSHPSVRA